MPRSTSCLDHSRRFPSGFGVHKISVGLGEITPIDLLSEEITLV
jgi:hypothetical protein